jgi:hypothetical protein
MLKEHRTEKIFLKLTTHSDREQIKKMIGALVVLSVMWRSIPKYFFIAGGTFLTLLLIYLL